MARYDVYPNPGQNPQVPFLLDVQSDLLSVLDTRVVVPLRRLDRGGSAQLDSISHFLSGSLAVNAYAALGSAGRLSK